MFYFTQEKPSSKKSEQNPTKLVNIASMMQKHFSRPLECGSYEALSPFTMSIVIKAFRICSCLSYVLSRVVTVWAIQG